LDTFFPAHAILYTLKGLNTDSGNEAVPAFFPGMERYLVDSSTLLYDTLAELRAVKTSMEIDFMAHVNHITCLAHAWVMKNTKPGLREFQQG